MSLQQTGGVKVTGLYCEIVSNGRVDFPAGAPIGRLQNSCPRDKFAQPFPGRTRKRVSRKRLVDEPSGKVQKERRRGLDETYTHRQSTDGSPCMFCALQIKDLNPFLPIMPVILQISAHRAHLNARRDALLLQPVAPELALGPAIF